MEAYKLFFDGNVSRNGSNDSKGSSSFILLKNGKVISGKSKYLPKKTNNYCELYGMMLGIKKIIKILEPDDSIDVYGDSSYVINSISNRWILSWEKENFQTKNGERPNAHLWKEYLQLEKIIFNNISFHWIKGHNGNYWNEIVDSLCSMCISQEQDLLISIL